jgi:hypothetical protein
VCVLLAISIICKQFHWTLKKSVHVYESVPQLFVSSRVLLNRVEEQKDPT